jgi:hypothetical protein
MIFDVKGNLIDKMNSSDGFISKIKVGNLKTGQYVVKLKAERNEYSQKFNVE